MHIKLVQHFPLSVLHYSKRHPEVETLCLNYDASESDDEKNRRQTETRALFKRKLRSNCFSLKLLKSVKSVKSLSKEYNLRFTGPLGVVVVMTDLRFMLN